MVADGTLRHVELQQHPLARSNDPTLLDFLATIREEQPSKNQIQAFFGNRRFAAGKNCRKDSHIASAVAESMRIEQETGKPFTFLTVTNQGARRINHTRCLMEFGDHERVQNAERYTIPGDPDLAGDAVVIPGMKVRLTRNVDKERGFVNGTLAEVEHILAKGVFVVKTPSGMRILVHPVRMDGRTFVPFCYGYAMTIRRSQGSTLASVGLWFDHCFPADRGYAYVGASRVRNATDLWLMGKVKRTDWLPVGAEKETEQTFREDDSQTTDSGSDFGSEDQGSSEEDEGDEDQGASTEESEQEDQGDSDDSSDKVQSDEDPGDSEDDSLGGEDQNVDYDRVVEAAVLEPAPAPPTAVSAPPALPLRPARPAAAAYSADAMAVVREWHAAEGIRGPFRQRLLTEKS